MSFPPRSLFPFEPLRCRNTLASAAVCLLLALPTAAGVAAPPSRQTLQEAGGQAGKDESAPRLIRKPRGARKFGKGLLNFLSCRSAYRMKRQELLAYGPQFPRRYDPSDFSFEALVNTGWPMVVEYELERQSTLTITIRAMGARPFVKTLTGEGRGRPQAAHFILPTYGGQGPHPALITFKATHDGTRGLSRAEFVLRAIGAGAGAVTAALEGPRGLEVASLGAPPAVGALSGPARPRRRAPAVNISDVVFRPGRGGEYVFTFTVGDIFNRWGADIKRTVRDKTTIARDDIRYDETIIPERVVNGSWDGMGANGRRVPRDDYWVFVMVWHSAYDRGEWAASGESNTIPVN